MGKAEILENLGDGLYRCQYKFGMETVDREVNRLNELLDENAKGILKLTDEITAITTDFNAAAETVDLIISEPGPMTKDRKDRLGKALGILNGLAVELKSKEAAKEVAKVTRDAMIAKSLSLTDLPREEERNVWIADYSIDIQPTGADIPTVEVAGEAREENHALLYPANNVAPLAFDRVIHGERTHALGISPSACFAAWTMLPGWQKYRPGHRVGKITKIVDGQYAKVELQVPLVSSEQMLPIPPSDPMIGDEVFERQTHERVPFKYMDCDSIAFSVGDEVLIEYKDHDSAQPVVVGFAHDPQPCAQLNVYTANKERLRCTKKQPGKWHTSNLETAPKFGSCYWVGDDGAVSWRGWRARYFAARYDSGTGTDEYFTSRSLYHRGQDYGPLPGIVLGGCVRKKYLFAICRVGVDEVMFSCPQIGEKDWKEAGRVDASKWPALAPYYFSASGLKAASAKAVDVLTATPGTQLVEMSRNGDAKTPPFAAAFKVSAKVKNTTIFPPLLPGADTGEGQIITEHGFAVDYIGETLVTLDRRSDFQLGFTFGPPDRQHEVQKVFIVCSALNLEYEHFHSHRILTYLDEGIRDEVIVATTQEIDHLNVSGGLGQVVSVTRRIDATSTSVAGGASTTITASQKITVTSGTSTRTLLPVTGRESASGSPTPSFFKLQSLFAPSTSLFPLSYTVADGLGHVVTSMPLSNEARSIPSLPDDSRLRLFGGGIPIGAG